jgi:hypothetical protein
VVYARINDEISQICSWADEFVPNYFGTLAWSLDGMLLEDYVHLFKECLLFYEVDPTREEIMDLVYALTRQLTPFLSIDGGRISLLYESLRLAIWDELKDDEKNFHDILAILNRIHTREDHRPEDYRKLLYHIVRMEPKSARSKLKCDGLILEVLTYCSAADLTAAFYEGAALGQEYFSTMGDFFAKTGTRLDVFPETLFMELTQYGDPDNPLVTALLGLERRYGPKAFFLPDDDRDGSGLVAKEYAYPDKSVSVYSADSCIVMKRGKVLQILDPNTLKIERMMQLSSVNGVILTEGDRFFLVYDSDQPESMETWSLPYLNRISSLSGLNVPKEYWSVELDFYVWNGEVFVVLRRWNSDHSSYMRLMRLNDGAMIFQRESTEYQDSSMGPIRYTQCRVAHVFAGGCLVLHNRGNNELSLVSLRDGAVVWEETQSRSGHMYAAADQTHLCIWYTTMNETMAWMFSLEGPQPRLIQHKSVSPLDGPVALVDHKLFVLRRNGMAVYDLSLDLLGSLAMEIPVHDAESGEPLLEVRGDFLLLYLDEKLVFFRFSDLMRRLEPQELPRFAPKKAAFRPDEKQAGYITDLPSGESIWYCSFHDHLIIPNIETGDSAWRLKIIRNYDYKCVFRYDYQEYTINGAQIFTGERRVKTGTIPTVVIAQRLDCNVPGRQKYRLHQIDLVVYEHVYRAVAGAVCGTDFSHFDEVYLEGPEIGQIDIYSLGAREITRTVQISDFYPTFPKVVRFRDWLIWHESFNSDLLYVYDLAQDRPLFTQRMEYELHELYVDHDTGTLYSRYHDGSYHTWRIHYPD